MHTNRHRQNNNTIGLPTAQSKSAPRDNVSFVVVVDVIVFVVVVVVAVVVYHVHWHFKAEFCLHAALSLPLSLSLAHCRCLLATACAAAASASLLVIVLSLYVLSLCVPFLRNKHRWLRLRGAPDKSSALKERAQKRERQRARGRPGVQRRGRAAQQQTADRQKLTGFLRFIFALAQATSAPLPLYCALWPCPTRPFYCSLYYYKVLVFAVDFNIEAAQSMSRQ